MVKKLIIAVVVGLLMALAINMTLNIFPTLSLKFLGLSFLFVLFWLEILEDIAENRKNNLKKRARIVAGAIIMALVTALTIAVAFNDVLPIPSTRAFFGVTFAFTLFYLTLGEIIEFQWFR